MRGCIRFAVSALLTLGAVAATARAQDSDGSVPGMGARQVEKYYWAVTTDDELRRRVGDLSGLVDFGGAPVSRDVVVFYSHLLGFHPVPGPHMIRRDPTYMARHLEEVRYDVERLIPDPSYDGLAIIDYEVWLLIWEWTINVPSSGSWNAEDHDFKDDWEEELRRGNPREFDGMNAEQKEAHLKATWEAQCKDFYLRTLEECKRMRPRAKWGYYMYPATTYYDPFTERGVIGYGDGTRYYRLQAMNDSLQWLWDAEDVLLPVIYAPCYTFPNGDRRASFEERRENWWSENHQFAYSNIREARRLARGKPVLAVQGMRYGTGVPPHDNQWLSNRNLYHQIVVTLQSRADGVVFWDHIREFDYFLEIQNFVTRSIAPMIREFEAHGDVELDEDE